MRRAAPATFTADPPTSRYGEQKPYDPLRLCVYTTVALIAWLITPPLTVAIFGGFGVAGYVRARRRGLARSKCKLGDTRLVIAYLAVIALAGSIATAVNLVRFLS